MVRTGTIILLSALAGSAPARAAGGEGNVGNGKVYAGPEGMTVTVLPSKTPGDRKLLVAVAGTGSPFDGKLLPHDLTGDGERKNYETTYHGRRWVTLTVRDGVTSLNVPGHRDGWNVWYDEQRTAALKPDPLYAAYSRQQADGSLKALMAFDRRGEIAQRDKEMQAGADEVAKLCGARPAVKVDWASFSDDDIKELSIASYCGEPLETMRRMCEESNEAKKTFAARVKTFSCAMGKTMQLELGGTTLTWTTARSATNIGAFARAYLESHL